MAKLFSVFLVHIRKMMYLCRRKKLNKYKLMKTRLAFFAIVAFALLLPAAAFAQSDSRAPGIYTIVGDTAVPLSYTRGSAYSFGISYVQLHTIVQFKKATSGTEASDVFVLVVDTTKTTFKATKPFVKQITPANMVILPLISNIAKKRREFDPGIIVANGWIYEEKVGLEFEWEPLTSNSYLIRVRNLPPGEYGISFFNIRWSSYDFYKAVFGFTIPNKK